MPWVRMEDKHPWCTDIQTAGGYQAGWMHYCAICYCSMNLTDGFVPDAALKTMTGIPRSGHVRRRLIDVGLFVEVEGGVRVKGYLERQSSRAEVEARRADNAARQRKSRSGRASVDPMSHGESHRDGEVTHGMSHAPVTPPIHIQVHTPTENSNSKTTDVREAFDELRESISGAAA